MILTLRDQRILTEIQSYGLLTTRMIAARHFKDTAMTTVLRRLRLLEHDGLIQRISGLEGGQLAWSLTQKSALRFNSVPSKIHFPRFVLDHDIKLVELRLQLEGVNLVHSWRPEHEIRAKVASRYGVRGISHRTIPDGLMGIENKGFKQTVAIELELSAKNQKRYRSIFWDYSRKKNLWGVWYVVGRKSIATQILTAAKSANYFRGEPYLFWSILDDVLKDPLNAKIFNGGNSYQICEVLKPVAAHPPAHTMSMQTAEK